VSRGGRIRARWLVVVTVAGAVAGCGKKSGDGASAPPEVTGLAAVPASAEVVIAADVARVVDAPLVSRAVDQLLQRDAELAARWQRLHDACKIDIATQVKHVVLAVGPHDGPQPGTGPVLMIATGTLVETELASCVRAMVGQGGGSLTAKDVAGHTLYRAKESNRDMFFAFGGPTTVVLGSNEAYVIEALGGGKKVLDNPDMKRWIGLADQKAPLWGAGKVDERVRSGLVKVTAGQVAHGPSAMVISMDPTMGVKLEVDAVMASPSDAKALESFAKQNLALLGMAAQAKGMEKVVDQITIAVDGSLVRFKATLDTNDVNQLLSGLDGGAVPAQVSPPAAGSGSSSPPAAP
jgi:hypothetical protein